MSGTINSCSFDPKGGNDFHSITPINPLQSNGAQDISVLVRDIITKDFGYTGTQHYTLTLRNQEMVLSLWNNSDGTSQREFAKLKLENRQWQLIKQDSDDITVLKDATETTNRLAHTLTRISKAYVAANPSANPSTNPKVSVEGQSTNTPPPVAHNHIYCDHSVITQLLDRSLNELNRRLEQLEHSIQTQQQPKTDQTEQTLRQLRSLVDPLHDQIARLQQDIRALKQENHDLKGLKEPLDKIARDVPEALREIRFSIDLLEMDLKQIAVNSQGAQQLILEEMRSEMEKMHQQIEPLAKAVQSLNQENDQLRKENEALRCKEEENIRNLLLKDKEIVDLTQQKRKTEKKLKKAETDLQARDVTIQSQQKTNGKLRAEVQDLKKQLAEQQKLIEQIGPLREQLQQANLKTCQREEELEKLQTEISTAKEAEKQKEKALETLKIQLQKTEQNVEVNYQKLVDAQQQIEELSLELKLTREKALKALTEHEAQFDESQEELLQLQDQMKLLATNKDEKSRERLDELEAEYKLLLAKNQQLEDANASARQLESHLLHQLDLSEKTAARVEEVEKQNQKLAGQVQSANEQQQGNAEHILTLQRMKSDLAQKNDELLGQIQSLKSQLDTADKVDQASQKGIQELGLSLQQKDKDLEKAKHEIAQAQSTAQKANETSKQLRGKLEETTSRLTEAQQDLDYTRNLLEGKSRELSSALKDLKLLQTDFKEFQQVSNALEAEQEEEILKLKKALADLQAQYDQKVQSLDQKTDRSEIEALKETYQKQVMKLSEALEKAEQAKDEVSITNAISDSLYQKQNAELQRRVNELEQNLLILQDRLTLKEKTLQTLTKEQKVPTFDLRNEPPVAQPTAVSQTLDNVDSALNKIEQNLGTLDDTVSPKWIGAILINLTFLEKSIPSDQMDQWIQSNFADSLSSEEMKRLNKSVPGHFEKVSSIPSTAKNIHGVAGELSAVLRDPAIKSLANPKNFESLDACFGEKLFIAKSLLHLKMKLIPIIERYDELPKKDSLRASIAQQFEKANTLLKKIDQVLGVMEKKLSEKRWKIQA